MTERQLPSMLGTVWLMKKQYSRFQKATWILDSGGFR